MHRPSFRLLQTQSMQQKCFNNLGSISLPFFYRIEFAFYMELSFQFLKHLKVYLFQLGKKCIDQCKFIILSLLFGGNDQLTNIFTIKSLAEVMFSFPIRQYVDELRSDHKRVISINSVSEWYTPKSPWYGLQNLKERQNTELALYKCIIFVQREASELPEVDANV